MKLNNQIQDTIQNIDPRGHASPHNVPFFD
jgi:hypothetical protein